MPSRPGAHLARGPASRAQPLRYDDRRVAEHEIAHAISHAVFPTIDPSLRVELLPDGSPSRGVVWSGLHITPPCSADGLDWFQANLVAGAAAERLLHGESLIGSENDWGRYLHVTSRRLGSENATTFFPSPTEQWQIDANLAAIEQSKARQLALATALIETNRSVFDDLVSDLLRLRALDAPALLPYLRRMTIPEDYPRPLGRTTNPSAIVIGDVVPGAPGA